MDFRENYNITVTYEFTEGNSIRIVYSGVSDKTTIANMTNHSYFNLSGEGSEVYWISILQSMHRNILLWEKARFPLEKMFPWKELLWISAEKKIGQEIDADFEQLKITGGYDHNYVTDGYTQAEIREIACARSEKTGIFMEALTDCPCVQFYAGNFIEDEKGKNEHLPET